MQSNMLDREGKNIENKKIGVKIGKSVDTNKNVMYNNIRRCGRR